MEFLKRFKEFEIPIALFEPTFAMLILRKQLKSDAIISTPGIYTGTKTFLHIVHGILIIFIYIQWISSHLIG